MPDHPDIIWLMTDEQRADAIHADGSPWVQTPALDQLAGDGVRFAAAYTPSPVCVSARAAMLTGRPGSATGVLNNHQHLPDEHAWFLTEGFAAAGYQTAGFGKHHYNHARPAFQVQHQRVLCDRVGYFDYQVAVDETAGEVVRYPATALNRAFPWILAGPFPGTLDETPEARTCADGLAWLAARDRDRPFLLRLSFNAPHTPVVAPAPYHRTIDPDAIALPEPAPGELAQLPPVVHDYLIQRAGAHRLTEAQLRRARQCYYGRVMAMDALVGQFLAQAAALEALDNALIAVVSDHGTHLGDHGFLQKQSFFEESVRVPWILCGPGVAGGTVVDCPVSVGSLLPTLAALAGVELPGGAEFPSLAAAATGAATAEAGPVFSEIDYGLWDYRPGERYIMVREGRWKLSLFRQPGGTRRGGTTPADDDGAMLFDLEADPQERRNLARSADHAATRGRLEGLIDAWDGQRAARRSCAQPE